MKSFIVNIEEATLKNANFRHVLHTAEHSQLVVMSIKPGEDIGEEIHDVDQFIRIEAGEGKAVLDGQETEIKEGSAVIVQAGTKHNIINTSPSTDLKIYTIYSPPNHKDGVIHKTREEAQAREGEDEFDGKISE